MPREQRVFHNLHKTAHKDDQNMPSPPSGGADPGLQSLQHRSGHVSTLYCRSCNVDGASVPCRWSLRGGASG